MISLELEAVIQAGILGTTILVSYLLIKSIKKEEKEKDKKI